jgi:hypothetical protein
MHLRDMQKRSRFIFGFLSYDEEDSQGVTYLKRFIATVQYGDRFFVFVR